MEDAHLEMLAEGARLAGVPLDAVKRRRFGLYLDELLLWNRRCNLVATMDPEEIIVRHVLDSLAPIPWLPGIEGRLLDIGSGAGFPGIPFKIALPSLEVCLLEASRKRSSFLKRVLGLLELNGIEAVWGRTEGYMGREGMAGSFDWVTSRAVFPLPRFAAEGAPFLKPGGHLLVMAGPGADDRSTPPASALLERVSSREYRLPFSGDHRKMIIYIKSN